MYEELISRLNILSTLTTENGESEILVSAEAVQAIREIASEAADAIEELSKQKWIPVTDRLPDGEAERYLVAVDFMAHGLWVSICYYADNLEEVDKYEFNGEKHGGFYGSDSEYGYYEKTGVKYWMPLPEPPKVET